MREADRNNCLLKIGAALAVALRRPNSAPIQKRTKELRQIRDEVVEELSAQTKAATRGHSNPLHT
jgi:hypothetical protein